MKTQHTCTDFQQKRPWNESNTATHTTATTTHHLILIQRSKIDLNQSSSLILFIFILMTQYSSYVTWLFSYNHCSHRINPPQWPYLWYTSNVAHTSHSLQYLHTVGSQICLTQIPPALHSCTQYLQTHISTVLKFIETLHDVLMIVFLCDSCMCISHVIDSIFNVVNLSRWSLEHLDKCKYFTDSWSMFLLEGRRISVQWMQYIRGI